MIADIPRDEVPLIWTSKGNLPLAELEHKVEWQVTADYVTFVSIHRYQGEIVRREPHILALKSLDQLLFATDQPGAAPAPTLN